MVKSHT